MCLRSETQLKPDASQWATSSGHTSWGALVGAEPYKKEGTEQPKTPPSAADLALLQSLDAKIKALTEAESKQPRMVRPRRGDGARVPGACTSLPSLPRIDSTQTVRPLSPYELVDDEATRWF